MHPITTTNDALHYARFCTEGKLVERENVTNDRIAAVTPGDTIMKHYGYNIRFAGVRTVLRVFADDAATTRRVLSSRV